MLHRLFNLEISTRKFSLKSSSKSKSRNGIQTFEDDNKNKDDNENEDVRINEETNERTNEWTKRNTQIEL